MDPSEKAECWESVLRARDLARELAASDASERPRASGTTPQEAAAEVEAAVAAAAAACKRPRASGPTTEEAGEDKNTSGPAKREEKVRGVRASGPVAVYYSTGDDADKWHPTSPGEAG